MPIYFQLMQQALPINLESIGNHWQQHAVNRNQGYPLYHWLQTESGLGEITIEGQQIRLNAGEGILIAPFTPHSYSPIDQWQTNFATFSGEIKSCFKQLLKVEQFVLAKNTEQFQFSLWINQIIDLHRQKQLEANMLSVECYKFLIQLRQGAIQPFVDLPTNAKKYLTPAIKEIETNFAQIDKIEVIAKNLYISPQYLSRLFQKYIHKSPYQYLIDYRINKGKEYLINQPNLEIQEIASRVGFQSPSQFIAIFKAKVELTPNAYRRLHY
ncbi:MULTISPECIES: helix-turn-helix domain-containing protein [unclassified Enterococcus]|uniref:AraC family transcriptional regulator n=1 Tax=unclassified Enterococcus TaxID=2608891 RepID=UPI0015534A00|nr:MULTISPECIES: helix-turn-helix domain-containing protein [unclassified Enterococcus]MBS7577662.1 AraC family transcriptional regulator [Enterococcus sp. MMGLQ5-2]MBS7584144.1 AraC family transcriptional regulator [Enterococcus sp. MMGLQ5-1]NPD12002.1 AraC family transcriptional regulator [Enterococcus sp. MMGLQ5-1]NPD37495.1 AraC family transcriptional regulator [Enterococcus sp. MMGLQ5-2]